MYGSFKVYIVLFLWQNIHKAIANCWPIYLVLLKISIISCFTYIIGHTHQCKRVSVRWTSMARRRWADKCSANKFNLPFRRSRCQSGPWTTVASGKIPFTSIFSDFFLAGTLQLYGKKSFDISYAAVALPTSCIKLNLSPNIGTDKHNGNFQLTHGTVRPSHPSKSNSSNFRCEWKTWNSFNTL